jgi:hypothetical protein
MLIYNYFFNFVMILNLHFIKNYLIIINLFNNKKYLTYFHHKNFNLPYKYQVMI